MLELATCWELCAAAASSQLFGPFPGNKNLQRSLEELRPFPPTLRNEVAHRGHLPSNTEAYAFAKDVWKSVNSVLGSLSRADELGSQDLIARVDAVTKEMVEAGSPPEYIQTPTRARLKTTDPGNTPRPPGTMW